MSTARNNIVKSNRPGSLFDDCSKLVSSTTDWNQGDLIVLVAGVLKPLDEATAQGALLVGVARQTIVDGKQLSPYQGTAVDAAQARSSLAGPISGVTATLVLKTGDAFAPGALVYGVDADPQTVTSVLDGAPVGVYNGPNVASAAAGQLGEICVTQNLLPNF
jgi:hypothetical protein